jgi:O-antigen/teichoic acid export membrane protein
MILALASIACLIGCAGLALAMSRHHKQVFLRELSRRRQRNLRAAGVALLLAGLLLCVGQAGWGSGAVWWTGMLSIAALTVTLLLSFRPNWLLRVFG